MSLPPPITEMMGMVLYLKEHKHRKEVCLRTASGKIYQVSVIHPVDNKHDLIPRSVYKCEYCPPKYSFKDGNCKYLFDKGGGRMEINEKTIHYLESHPDKFPREWLIKITSFFGETAKL